ncbi:MAG TPA: porin family protein [Bradyrhizobium sp.]|nr:porin family protein [Bradyrhizobium sp.]
MSKKLLAIALGTAATISVAHAAQPTFYAGGDITALTTKIDDKSGIAPDVSGSAKATTLRLRGGMHILDWLDAELHLVLPQDKTYSTTLGVDNKVKTTVVGLFAKPYVNAGPVSFYGLLGLAQSKMDFSGGVVSTSSQNESGVAYGVGVQYPFTKNLSGSIDYVQYLPKKSVSFLDVDNKAFGVGVTYTFK